MHVAVADGRVFFRSWNPSGKWKRLRRNQRVQVAPCSSRAARIDAVSRERKLRMRILLAGASGAIGMPLIGRLRTAGHDVLAIHRSPAGRARLAAAGAMPVRADVLDRAALRRALDGREADAVIAELTSLKKPPTSHKDMAATNILRIDGTRNLIEAAGQVGAVRFITQSMVSDTVSATGAAGC